jgi:predicted TIM-barrel fold metal-dependent hydrolase
LATQLKSGGIEVVRRRAAAADVHLTVVSALRALIPYGGDVLGGNDEARQAADAHSDIRFWAVLNPRIERSYTQIEALLAHPSCPGIKIHPKDHAYDIRDYGDEVFGFAAGHQVLIIAHTGDPGCFPEDFIPFANSYPDASLILSHLGYSADGALSRQVHALKRAEARNVYLDTSSKVSISSGLIEWAVAEVGEGRLLFGTDTPLNCVACQKARIEYAEISQQAKRAILFENAARLLGEVKRP